MSLWVGSRRLGNPAAGASRPRRGGIRIVAHVDMRTRNSRTGYGELRILSRGYVDQQGTRMSDV